MYSKRYVRTPPSYKPGGFRRPPRHPISYLFSVCVTFIIIVFYRIARSYRNLALPMSVFYPTARSYGNLAIQMSVFNPIARSYGNLATEMAVFMLQTLTSSYEFNVSDVKGVWYKNGTPKTRPRNIQFILKRDWI